MTSNPVPQQAAPAAAPPQGTRSGPLPVPRTLRLAPHRSLLPRGPAARLLGLDPDTALVVEDLPPPLARMLDELAAPADRDGLVARAVRRGADAATADDLLVRLVDAGALVDAAAAERSARRRTEAVVVVSGTGPLAVGVAAGLALAGVGTVYADAAVYGGAAAGAPARGARIDHGARIGRAADRGGVGPASDGTAGGGTANGGAANGGADSGGADSGAPGRGADAARGRRGSTDGGAASRPVGSRDLGTGLVDTDRGRPRLDALLDVVRRVAPDTRVAPAPRRCVPDLCVLADAAAPDPVLIGALQLDRVPHLPVRLRDGTGVVGPLVLPGRSACLGCLELHRRTRDPGWPVVAAQLLGREGSGEPEAAAATAALCVAQVLAVVDGVAPRAGPGGDARPGTVGDECAGTGGAGEPPGGAPPVVGATLELDVAAGTLVRRPWSAHPDCTCGPPRGETCGQRGGRGTITG